MTIEAQISRWIAILGASSQPSATPAQARALVAELRAQAQRAPEIVAQVTGLTDALGAAQSVQVLVVDRANWAYGAAQAVKAMLPPEEVGLALASSGLGVMAPFVMGQFDPYGAGDGDGSGRLLLNAPTVAQFRERYNLDQRDLCLWVCVHEFTHALQYASAPWLKEFMTEQLVSAFEESETNPLESVGGMKMRATMTLLEGHAEYTMNNVPLTKIPSRKRIVSAMAKRRKDHKGLAAALAKSAGMAQKASQYSEGSDFVSAVIRKRGKDEFNKVWERPENLPTLEELANPDEWIARVLA